jgi:hypothetical protein
MPPLAIMGGLAAAGSIGGAAIGASAAGNAADTQAQAAEKVAALQKQSSDQALATQQQQYLNSNALSSPWYMGGASAEANLLSQMGLLSPTQASQPLINPAQLPATTAAGNQATLNVGTKPNYMSLVDWNNLGKNQQLAISNPGASIPTGVVQNGSRPDDFSAAAWAKVPQNVKDALMDVGKPAPAAAQGAPSAQPGATGTSLGDLVNPAAGAPGSLVWKPPTEVTMQNDPGYQFRQQQGELAMNRSAAAKGNLLTGGTAAALQRYGQDYASNEFQNVYNRAANDFSTRYNSLANLAGQGQLSANQIGNNGQQYAGQASNTLLNSANMQGQQMNNAAAATASGYVGGANAWANGLGGATNNLSQMYLLNQLYGGGASQPIDMGGR